MSNLMTQTFCLFSLEYLLTVTQKLATLVNEHDPTKPLIIPFIYRLPVLHFRSYIDPTHKLASL